MIFNQGTHPECKGYGFLNAISILNPKSDFVSIISAINENESGLLTNRKAGEFFKSRGFIKGYEEVPRLKAKALLNRGIPLIANIHSVDWEKTSKPPYIANFDGHTGAHNCTIVGYDNHTRLLKVANTYGESWGDNGYYYLHADNLDKVTEFCQIIMQSNFSKYIDSLIAGNPIDVDGSYGAQCVDFARAVASHLGYPITSYGNAWDIYLKGSDGYRYETPGSYIPLPGDLIFMRPTKSNGKAGHIAVADEGCTMAVYKVVHQNYGVQGTSGSGIGDRHAKRQTIPAQQWGGILAREVPFM